jgi:hypothetical protein
MSRWIIPFDLLTTAKRRTRIANIYDWTILKKWNRLLLSPGNACRFKRSMQHHLISRSDNTLPVQPIRLAVLGQNLNRVAFRLI